MPGVTGALVLMPVPTPVAPSPQLGHAMPRRRRSTQSGTTSSPTSCEPWPKLATQTAPSSDVPDPQLTRSGVGAVVVGAAVVGDPVGNGVGCGVGVLVGETLVGALVGEAVVGATVGSRLGWEDAGEEVGVFVGVAVGETVPCSQM